MGRMHYRCWRSLAGTTVAAVCDADPHALDESARNRGNIAGAEGDVDLAGVKVYADFDDLLRQEPLDALSITIPTHLHPAATIAALDAGLHVLCEKPMALNRADGTRMIEAAQRSGKVLQIGHCIRFWPEYAKTKELIDSGQYGKVRAAMFQRLSLTPTWAWDGWLMDPARSGSAAMDLHIHDSDFVQYVFGMPKAVFSRTARGPSNDADHIVTQYVYDEDCVVTAEGGWAMSPTFGFEMSFNIVLEKATIVYDCTRSPAFKVCPVEGDAFTPEVASGDGYANEIAHFVKAVRGETVPPIITPEQSVDSVRLVLAEKQSAASGEKALL